jgi:hypothetical protein
MENSAVAANRTGPIRIRNAPLIIGFAGLPEDWLHSMLRCFMFFLLVGRLGQDEIHLHKIVDPP